MFVCQAEHDKKEISFVSDPWNDEKIADGLGASPPPPPRSIISSRADALNPRKD